MTLIPVYRCRAERRCTPRAPASAPPSAARSPWWARSTAIRWCSPARSPAIWLAGRRAGVGREVARSLRLALPLALLVALVNPLVYQGGDTLLVRGGDFLGRRWDITLEARVEGR